MVLTTACLSYLLAIVWSPVKKLKQLCFAPDPPRRLAFFCAVAASFGLLAGCDSRPQVTSSAQPATPPVQGELIQKKEAPAAPAPTAGAPAASEPPVTAKVGLKDPEKGLSREGQPLSSTATVSNPPGGPAAGAALAPSAAVTSTAVSASNAPVVLGEPTKLPDGSLAVGFDRLSSFSFEVTDEILQSNTTNATQVASRTAEQIPKTVMAYDQKRIALKGFMLPLKVEGGKVTEMLIMRDQSMCCYGAVPKINEWVSVKMVGSGVRPIMDQAVTLYGKLHVGEMRENGYLVGIYRMDGERIDGPAEN